MGHLLSGPAYSDKDTFIVGWDDHITCMDTYVWDPGASGISMVSSQDDTTIHTRYKAIHIEATIYDDL
jgi:hypothetical protein